VGVTVLAGVVGAAWALVVLVAAGPGGVRLARGRALRSTAAVTPEHGGSGVRASAGTAGPITRLGGLVRRLAGRPPDPVADRTVGLVIVAAGTLGALAPWLAALPVVWGALGPTLAARRVGRAHHAAVVDQLPDVVDLLVLTTGAGLPVTAALAAIDDRPGGPLGTAIAAAVRHGQHGGITADALAVLGERAGPVVRPLVDALAEHDRYGTPIGPALTRAGIEARIRRRRQAEEAARRLPVTLLFPLVLTTLPAFFLLAIVPLLAGSLGSLTP
jgi:tight adherence protein C